MDLGGVLLLKGLIKLYPLSIIDLALLPERVHGWVKHFIFLSHYLVHVEEGEGQLPDVALGSLHSLVGKPCFFLEQLVEFF